jgi:D-tyrosyl-tRNA(Tyr) deacylase
MRAIIQRSKSASVIVNSDVVGSIASGFVVLLGIEDADTEEDVEWLVAKLLGLRIFPDDLGKMNKDIREANGGILVISQFTLFASTKKGNRPSFIRSAGVAIALPLYQLFLEHAERSFGKKIESGIFGADMQVNLINDGPVTIFIDTKNKE